MRLPNWLSQPLAPIAPYTPYLVRGTYVGLCLLAPVLLFLTFFNPNVLNVTHIGWALEADWGQHLNGWNAYRHCADSFNHQHCMAGPVGNTLISTDSNPPFAFLFKPFAQWLPANFQYIGLWFFFCVCMHFLFAWKLIRPHAPNRWLALLGAISLSALPALYYRMRHDTLMAQWLILWALHLFINVPDDELPQPAKPGVLPFALSWLVRGAKMRGYIAMLGFAGLLHPYLLFMVAAIWGGDVLKRFWPAARKLDRAVILDTIARAIFVLLVVALALWLAGSFTKGMSPGAAGYGYYSFPLDGWFNPVRPDFSTVLRAWPLDAGQAFEGYQYLGFGLIVLVVAAVALYIATPEARLSKDFLNRLKPLTLPFSALFLIAASNHVQFYSVDLVNLKLPDALRGPAAVLRASGRLVWPITYCLVLAALVVLFKSRPRVVGVLLPLVLVVQAYDLQGFSAAMRKATSQAASSKVFYLTPSPVWDKLVADSTGIDFYPAQVHLNDKLFYELTWRATSQVKPVNTMYAARENLLQIAYQDQGMSAFRHGEIKDDHLFVFLKQCDAPASLWPRLRMLDGVWIIPPASAGNLDDQLAKPQWSPVASKLRFGWLDQGTCLLDENWSKPDVEGVWSDGPKAGIVIPIKHVQFDTPSPRKLDLKFQARSHVPVSVTVVVNGIKLDKISLSRVKSDNTIHLPASVLHGENLKIRFLVDGQDSAEPQTVAPVMPVNITGRGALPAPKAAVVQANPAAALGIKLMNMALVDPDAPVEPVLKPATGT